MGHMGIYDVGMIFACMELDWIYCESVQSSCPRLSRTEVGIKVMRAGEDNTISKTGW